MSSPNQQNALRSSRLNLVTLFVIAFVVRFLYAQWGMWQAGDSPSYIAIARNLAFHHSFSEITGVSTATRPPLYPLLIAAFWWTNEAPISLVILMQLICGTATVVLVYLIAMNHFDKRVALLAALGLTFAPMTVHYTAVILTETVFTFLIVLGVFFWGRNRAIAAGLVFGFAALTRSIVVPFLVCLPLLALLPPWRNQRRLYLQIFLIAIGVATVWTIRNGIVFRQFILVQSSGYGTNLLAGTVAAPIYGDDVWSSVNEDLRSNTDSSRDEVQRDREYMLRAIDRIKSDPLHYLRVRLKQYPRLFLDSGDYLLGACNVTFAEAVQKGHYWVVLTKVSFVMGNVVILALAIYGIVSEKRRLVGLTHLALFPAFLLLAHLPMWIENRYSLPIMPFVLIFAARGLEKLLFSRARVSPTSGARLPQPV